MIPNDFVTSNRHGPGQSRFHGSAATLGDFAGRTAGAFRAKALTVLANPMRERGLAARGRSHLDRDGRDVCLAAGQRVAHRASLLHHVGEFMGRVVEWTTCGPRVLLARNVDGDDVGVVF